MTRHRVHYTSTPFDEEFRTTPPHSRQEVTAKIRAHLLHLADHHLHILRLQAGYLQAKERKQRKAKMSAQSAEWLKAEIREQNRIAEIERLGPAGYAGGANLYHVHLAEARQRLQKARDDLARVSAETGL